MPDETSPPAKGVLPSVAATTYPTDTRTFFYRLIKLTEAHYADEYFGVPELSQMLCLCPMQVHRKVKWHTGLSPGQYLLHFRLAKAQVLLKETDFNIGEIADMTGFASQNYFARAFRKVFGITPREARR